ncbi:DNA integrity scanning protein DisA nucleotide-binding domain protein [Hymenobacter aerilatus]|uniref:DNA integrity scanning protein DisA nucleotide-binding domain protein n=1 Tax=Hymenobacter aerilatus TaxID=2932251 RepID=A0A8T9T1X8_9BACT|nr:DNA integrity scanning protein DisA nucleotide-binding domain protein [Hymenobacter aerilatus]UOR06570.1 DNA integrity scanning protein DisA nucleotide-binding domain protein [Hymenobacter aerilatus]
MWEHQSLFRVSAQLSADGVFNLLDRNLKPEVLLLGLASAKEADDPGAIVVEPAKHRYAPARFTGVKEYAASLEPEGPREVVYHLHPLDHDRYEKARWYELLRRSTEHTLTQLVEQQQENRVNFCSAPIHVHGYLVIVVLQLAADSYHSYYILPSVPGGRANSLLDAVVQEFLQDCGRALRETENDEDHPILDRDYNEVLRAAGRRFMLRAAAGTHGLYDACNGVAALRHEGDEGVGTMLVGRRHHPAIKPVLTLDAPIPLRDHRSIRKLLEMSEDRASLVSDATDVFGLGYLVDTDDPQYEPVFTVHFTRHYSWELSHDGNVMMRVVSNTPRLPQGTVAQDNFGRVVQRVFPHLEATGVDQLWALTQKATTQSNGTILLISEGAAQEAARLTRQCFQVTPRLMTPGLLRLVTNIDGAVLIDPAGTCYGIGAILDGLATAKGDSSRGSRYNSALRYVESSQYPCLAIVVSEDGWIDLLPTKK